MSVDFMYFNWWTEGDDLWVRHDCNGTVEEWKAPSPWRLDGKGGVTPSFDCKRCGRHTILHATDRIDAPALTDEEWRTVSDTAVFGCAANGHADARAELARRSAATPGAPEAPDNDDVPHDPIVDGGPCPICNEPWPCAERKRQRVIKKECERLVLGRALWEPKRTPDTPNNRVRWVPRDGFGARGPAMVVHLGYGVGDLVAEVYDADGKRLDATEHLSMAWLGRFVS